MTNPNTLVDAIVTALKSITDVVAAVTSADNIVAYHDDYPNYVSLEQAIQELPPPAILVAWNETNTGRFGGNQAMSHTFHIILRPRSSAADLFSAIREGVCGTTGLKFKLSQVHTDCFPPANLSCSRQLIAVAADTVIETFIISLALIERGIDN